MIELTTIISVTDHVIPPTPIYASSAYHSQSFSSFILSTTSEHSESTQDKDCAMDEEYHVPGDYDMHEVCDVIEEHGMEVDYDTVEDYAMDEDYEIGTF